jgi:SAM-dependent methyltransferase
MTFDTIFASLCDPYCYPAALCEFSRILKPNGHLVISTPAKMWSNGIRETGEESITTFQLRSSLQEKVYSFTFHIAELLSLLRLCNLYPVDYCVMRASQCGKGVLPPAIAASCDHLQIKENRLEVLNCVVAKKRGGNIEDMS